MTSHRDIGAERVEIDPAEFPVLARHWPSVPPNWRHVGEITAEIVDRIASKHAVDDDDHKAAA